MQNSGRVNSCASLKSLFRFGKLSTRVDARHPEALLNICVLIDAWARESCSAAGTAPLKWTRRGFFGKKKKIFDYRVAELARVPILGGRSGTLASSATW
jgi:hypothetical protein